jgi:hypothetical protein
LKQEFPELLPIKESLIKYVFKPNQKTAAAWCYRREVIDELLSIKESFIKYVFQAEWCLNFRFGSFWFPYFYLLKMGPVGWCDLST